MKQNMYRIRRHPCRGKRWKLHQCNRRMRARPLRTSLTVLMERDNTCVKKEKTARDGTPEPIKNNKTVRVGTPGPMREEHAMWKSLRRMRRGAGSETPKTRQSSPVNATPSTLKTWASSVRTQAGSSTARSSECHRLTDVQEEVEARSTHVAQVKKKTKREKWKCQEER